MFGSRGSGVGGHTMCIDDSPPSLSSYGMLKERTMDATIETERITKIMKLQ
jgi:hypothetical protein